MPPLSAEEVAVDIPPCVDSTVLVKKLPPTQPAASIARRVAALVMLMLLVGSYWVSSRWSTATPDTKPRLEMAKYVHNIQPNDQKEASITTPTPETSTGSAPASQPPNTVPSPSLSPSSSSHGREETVSDILACLKLGRKGGSIQYYSTEQRACLPFPKGKANKGAVSYRHPADATLTTTMATTDNDGSGPSGIFNASSQTLDSSLDSVVVKQSPSFHSRWLFESWRLWEGELACPAATAPKGRGMAAQEDAEGQELEPFNITKYITTLGKTDASEYSTNGEHNTSLPNNVYDLRNFCVDELTGALLSFEEHFTVNTSGGFYEGNRPAKMDSVEALTEHVYGVKFLAFQRFFHPSNTEKVQITMGPKAQHSWKSVVSSSIEAHHRKALANGDLPATSSSLPPEILFVEDQAILISASGFEFKNPGHQFHRLGSDLALARLLEARTMLVLIDLMAEDTNDRIIRSRRFAKGGSGVDAELVPLYLVTHVERHEVEGDGRRRSEDQNSIATPAMQLSMDEMRDLPRRPFKRDGDHMRVLEMAMAEADSALSSQLPFETEFSPLLSSGEEGCEEVRCDKEQGRQHMCSEDARAQRRRCGRTYAMVNVALPLVQEVDTSTGVHVPVRPDTQNYSTTVWGRAVRDTLREARLVKKAIWETMKGIRPIDTNLSLSTSRRSRTIADQYRYLTVWRERMIAMASSFSRPPQHFAEGPPEQAKFMFHDYFLDFFGYRLEALHYLEQQGTSLLEAEEKLSIHTRGGPKTPSPTNPRRQLICYQRAAVAHVFHERATEVNPVAGIGLSKNANCNLKDTMRLIYDSVWARYGMCSPDEKDSDSHKTETTKQKRDPQKDSNRDAHPIFLLLDHQQRDLQDAFAKSKVAVEALLKTESALPPSQRNIEALEAAITKAQKVYDDKYMSYFQSQVATATVGGSSRQVRVFVAFRSAKRALTHWRHHLTALMHQGLGRYVAFEFNEGLAGGTFSTKDLGYSTSDPLNTARAQQYHSYLSTDIFIGPHGADMHSSAFVKPSALVTELASDGFDNTNVRQFNGGYFSAFAYAKNVGYLKVLTHAKYTTPEYTDPWASEHQSYMSLPDLRQMLSVSVCSWLAMNAVRLADEEVALKGNTSSDLTDFSYIVPWWCRGGARAVTQDERAALQTRSPDEQDAFFQGRLAPTGYGFSQPRCAPLTATVVKAGDALSIGPTVIDQNQLNRLQTECALHVSQDSYNASELCDTRRHVEGLQSLMESMLLMEEGEAQVLARYIVMGAAPSATTGEGLLCGEGRLNVTDIANSKQCIISLLESIGKGSVIGGVSPKFVSAVAANSHLSDNLMKQLSFTNSTVQQSVFGYIAEQFLAAPARPTVRDGGLPLLTTTDFSYGWKCSSGSE